MASREQRPPSPSLDAGTAPAASHGLRQWWRCRPGAFGLPRGGLQAKKVLLHSAWVSAVGLFLIRLATAEANGAATEARFFAIAGAALASLPWLLLFLASASVTALLEAGVCDLTWVFAGSGGGPPQRKQKPDPNGGDDRDEDEIDAGNGSGGTGGQERKEADGTATCEANGNIDGVGDGVCLSMTSDESASSPVWEITPVSPIAEASTSSSVSPLAEEQASTSSSASPAEEQPPTAADEAPSSPAGSDKKEPPSASDEKEPPSA